MVSCIQLPPPKSKTLVLSSFLFKYFTLINHAVYNLCPHPPSGKRACVGESLARMEIFLFLVSLIQRFTFSSPSGPDSMNLAPEYSSFANLAHSYQLIATPR